MALSRSERFKLKSGLIEEMDRDHLNWDFETKNLLLSEFGFEALEAGGWESPSFGEIISKISDSDLLEMYSVVTGADPAEFSDAAAMDDTGNWKSGYVRLFISHSEEHKDFVGEVSNELAVVGIDGFVAPQAMTYNKPWQDQIEQALWSMQAFVAIVHPQFQTSGWCHQEVGWALGRRVPRYAIRMGADPAGFITRDQWPSMPGATAKQVAGVITEWVSGIPDLGEFMRNGLFASLEAAGDYVSAGAAAERIATLGSLTDDQWDRLDRIYWENDQIRGGVLPSRALRPFYHQHWR